MGSLSTRRRRSAIWWGIFLGALVLVAAYILFDLLDVDGSEQPGRATRTTIAAELQPLPLGRGGPPELPPFGSVEAVSPAGASLRRAGLRRGAPMSTAHRLRRSALRPRRPRQSAAPLASLAPTEPA